MSVINNDSQTAVKLPSMKIESQTLHIGDAREMVGVADDSVSLVITSPPYWNLKDYGDSDREIGSSDYATYLEEMNAVWKECYRVTKPGGVMIININSRRSKGVYYPIAFDIVARMQDWTFWDHNIWYIPNALPQPNAYMERLLDNKHESLLVFVKGDAKSYKFHKPRVPQKYITADPRSEKKNSSGRCLGNILRIPAYRPPNIKSMGYHVAAYPEELVAFFIATYTDPGELVLDPFTGSGTTLKVANAMGRPGIGFEVHKDYADLIRRRIAEPWETPDWKSLDILHSATMQTGSQKPRKAHFSKKANAKDLFSE